MALIPDILEYFDHVFSTYLTRFIGALLYLLIGIVLGRLGGRLVHKILHELEFDSFMRNHTRIRVSLEELASRLVEYIIYFIAILIALRKLGLVSGVLQFVAASIIILVIVSVILGLKDFIPNIIAGMRMQQKRYFFVGDKVSVRDAERVVEGSITSITLLETVIKTRNGDILYIPNSLLGKSIVRKRKN